MTQIYVYNIYDVSQVGLMRQGRLLAEASPTRLTQHFGIASLEDIFLKLCLQDGDLENKHLEKVGVSYIINKISKNI